MNELSVQFPLSMNYPRLNSTQDMSVRSLLSRLTAAPVDFTGCDGSDGINSDMDTFFSTGRSELGRITYKLTVDQARRPYTRVWFVMAADNTTVIAQAGDPIGSIHVGFDDDISSSIEIVAGETIADWSFRDEGEQLPITRAGPQVHKLYFDLQGTPLRASQLLATELSIASVERPRQIREITIADESPDAALHIVAVLLDPGLDPAPTSPVANFTPVCFAALPPSDVAVDIERKASEFFLQLSSEPSYRESIARSREGGLQVGCGSASSLTFPLQIPFYIGNVFEVRSTSVGVSAYTSMQIKFSRTNTAEGTGYLYLLMNVRNICYQSDALGTNNVIGQIRVNDESPIDLIVGENIRQGRTNFKQCGTNDDYMLLNAQLRNERAVAFAGMALPALPDPNETGGQHAELWLDLLKVKLPQSSEDHIDLVVSVRNQLAGAYDVENVFITLYAATLSVE
jgi:hypothetical protein